MNNSNSGRYTGGKSSTGSSSSRRVTSSGYGRDSRTGAVRRKNATSSQTRNYGQQTQTRKTSGTARPQTGGKRPIKKKRKKHVKLRFALKIIFLLFLVAILVGMGLFYFKYGNTLLRWQSEAKELVDQSTPDSFKSSEASFIYDNKNKPIAKLKGDRDSYYLTFDEIPQAVKDCFIETEDRDFYEHDGYDLKALASAGFQLVKAKLRGEDASRGASTITQQLARGVFPNYLNYLDKSYSRKIREIFVAMEMEKKYSKDQILEFYINNVFFANGYYGVEAAARGYFSKSVKDLDLGEIAFICSIPNRPQSYDPLEHFDNTVKRKNRILDQLLQLKCISAAEYKDAYYEDIVMKPAQDIKTQDNLTTYAISCATKALMQKQGFEFRYAFSSDADREAYDKEYSKVYEECYKSLFNSGYCIYTTLDKNIQKKLQSAVNEQLSAFTEKTKKVYALQGAATCINNETGRVVAIVGGRKQKNLTGYTMNRGYLAFRQPGSSFKPIAVYAPALERGYTPDTIVDDSRIKDGPKNSDGSYLGKIPLHTAVEKSKNVVAWRVFEDITPQVGLSYVQKMNFSKIVDDDFVPAASLGGLTKGVSTVEMASAYATLCNNGRFRNPTCIKKITDYNGKLVLNMNKLVKEKQVYTEQAANNMTEILKGVLTRGTAAGKGLSDMPSAGKTGTTSDKKDGWFCGYTPYYSTAVWVGYDIPRTLDTLYGSTYPLYIWHEFMEELHSGLPYKDFVYEGTDENDSSTYESDGMTDTEEVTTDEPTETIDPDAAEVTENPEGAEVSADPNGENGDGSAATQDPNGENGNSSGTVTKAPATAKPADASGNAGKPTKKPSTKPANDNQSQDVGNETTVEDVGIGE